MPAYDCPECGGGFPSPSTRPKNGIAADERCCPWCGEQLNGESNRPATLGTPTIDPTPAFDRWQQERRRKGERDLNVDFSPPNDGREIDFEPQGRSLSRRDEIGMMRDLGTSRSVEVDFE